MGFHAIKLTSKLLPFAAQSDKGMMELTLVNFNKSRMRLQLSATRLTKSIKLQLQSPSSHPLVQFLLLLWVPHYLQ